MGKWKINSCPRCGGSLFVDRDMDGWYEQCLNCSYRNELASVESTRLPVNAKEGPPSGQPFNQQPGSRHL